MRLMVFIESANTASTGQEAIRSREAALKPNAVTMAEHRNIDAGDADCIVQFGIFGEVVYG